MLGSEGYEAMNEELRKDEKKLSVSFHLKFIFIEYYQKTRKSPFCSFSPTFEPRRRFTDRKKNEKQASHFSIDGYAGEKQPRSPFHCFELPQKIVYFWRKQKRNERARNYRKAKQVYSLQ